MDRSRVVTSPGSVLLVALTSVALASAQAPARRPADAGVLGNLLAGPATTGTGTFVLVNGALEPAPEAVPLLIQTDVFRGADRRTRIAVALAAEVPRAATGRLLVVATSADAAGPRRVVGEATGSAQPGRLRLVGEFALAPGEYEVHAGVSFPRPEGGTIAALARSPLSVPDLGSGALAISPLVLGETVAAAPRTPDSRAFNFGTTALSPAASLHFQQNADLHVAFRIFNWSAEPGAKPDVAAEYKFYQQGARRLIFFNRIKPQRLAADTLSDTFDPATGVVTAGMTVPLQSFPPGEFQLTVVVTDQRTKQSAERNVRFVVSS